MESGDEEVTYCADDDEYKIYCDIFDKLCFQRFYIKCLKSGTHITNTRKRQQLK